MHFLMFYKASLTTPQQRIAINSDTWQKYQCVINHGSITDRLNHGSIIDRLNHGSIIDRLNHGSIIDRLKHGYVTWEV